MDQRGQEVLPDVREHTQPAGKGATFYRQIGAIGGAVTRDRHGMERLRRLASDGGNATVERYSVQYMRAIGSAGGISRAAKMRARLHASGASLEASLGRS